MKKSINRSLMLVSALAIFLTTIFVTLVYYEVFKGQIMDDLRTSALLACDLVSDEEQLADMGMELEKNSMRLTVIEADGNVYYDSEADYESMENHSNRPEIITAFSEGEGQAVRRSETLSKNIFYYAVRMNSGSVLRLSKDAGSIYSIFMQAIPTMLVILVLLFALCFITSHFLTVRLIAPIEKLANNLDEYNDVTDYDELTPFVNMIKDHHKDIMKNALMRQEFSANVSHELKTPLTSISGYAELIETGMASDEDVVRFAKGIHKSANRLMTLINDIIRLSELDGESEEVPLEKLDLYELADTCVEMLGVSAEKHNVTICMSGNRESYIQGNRQMIEELLYNLCDNAIRYNNADGRVDVCVYPKKEGIVLEVKDTGIGIPKEHQDRIFERFYRVDKSRSKSTGGTGLGLAIVKHIIVRHNAQMELESETGKGTDIKVTFPHIQINHA